MADKRLIYIILLASAMTLLALAMGAAAQTPPPASGSWYISDVTSYSNTDIELDTGDIIVNAGGSLTLTNVNLNFDRTSGLSKIQVYEGGTLNVQGGSITYTTGAMIYPPQFVLQSPCTINGTRIADTAGIGIYSWGTSITNCTVTHPTYALLSAIPSASSLPSLGPIVIADNTIPISDRAGISGRIQDFSTQKGHLVIVGNYLWNIGGDGISIEADCEAAEIIVEDNTLGSIGGDGIVLDLNVSDLKLRFDGNDVEDADGDGVRLLLKFDALDFPGIDGLRSVNADQMGLRITLMQDFMNNVTFSGLDIQDGGLGGISFNGVLNASIIDSSIDCPTSTDFIIARSTVVIFRTSHQQGDATVNYAISSISSYRTVEITCRWLSDRPIANRAISLYSPDDDKYIYAELTDNVGHIREYLIVDWIKTSSDYTVRTILKPMLSLGSGRYLNSTEPIIFNQDINKVVYFGDFEVPVVTITSPIGNQIQNITSIDVVGTAIDSISGVVLVQVSVDNEPDWALKTWINAMGTDDWTYTFTDLPDGVYNIYVRAFDFANAPDRLHGNATVTNITVDTIPPQVVISYPAQPSLAQTTVPTFLIEGNVSEEVVYFHVNGVSYPLDGTSFSIDVDLVQGLNEFYIQTQDPAGNGREFYPSIQVIYDPVPPVITITAPTDGALLDTDSVIVQGTVDKELRDGQVLIDGTLVTLNGNTFEYLVIGLEEGENTVTVSGIDLAGNSGEASVTITVDTIAPTVTITSPEDGLLTNVGTVTVEGTVSETGVAVHVNGATATVTGTDFTFTYDLQEGDNNIVVTAVDAVDNLGEDSVLVTLDTVAPNLVLHGLDNGTLTTEGDTQDVTGSTDPDATVTMVVGGVEMTAHVGSDGSFRHTITITDVETLVTVRAGDLAGNTVYEDVLIYKKKAADIPDEAPVLTPEQATVVALATTSIIILGAAVSIEFTKYALILLLLPLYARLKKDAVLDNKTRLALHGLVVENPGMHYNEIIREFGLTNGVAAYHLDVLEREGFIRSIRDGTKRRFYSTTTKVPEDTKLTPDQTREYILQLITDKPGISQKEVVDELGIGRTLVGYHLKTLIDEGYIKASRKGRFTVYSRTQKRWYQST